METFKGQRAVVVGLGRSGVAAARFLAEAGARVTAADAKAKGGLAQAVRALEGLDIAFAFGPHGEGLFEEASLIVASPGVPLELPGIARARCRGVPVVGEMELAIRTLDRPVLAVTGTNGKTTTTALAGRLLNAGGVRACVAGNIGTPLLEALPEARRAEWVVLEVSSFQIETTPSLSPRIGVLLNVTPDHLDRHASFEAYAACKGRLIQMIPAKGWGIYNVADAAVVRAVRGMACRPAPFDGTGKPLKEGRSETGAWFEGGDLVVRLEGGGRHRFPLSRVKLAGAHNRENMLAALAASLLAGADPARLGPALESFTGLPHRVELVGEHRGVRYYDDSKGTNVGATIRALESFSEPIVLIAGGLAKGADLSLLAPHVPGRVKAAVLIGEAAAEIEDCLRGATSTVRAGTMEEAVLLASSRASAGDVVLLSPACASFDMFRDYADRGRAFARAVGKIRGS